MLELPAPDADKAAVRAYQLRAGLVTDGIRGPVTVSALHADEVARRTKGLEDFSGSLGCVIQCEGFQGYPHWPGGASGVTLDFGFDLGNHSREELERHYGGLWPPAAFNALASAVHLGGEKARQWWTERGQQAQRGPWPITRTQAAERLPAIAQPYWAAVRWCWGGAAQAPPEAQAVALSVVYNGWLSPLREILPQLERRDWKAAAAILRGMGNPTRRKVEAGLLERAGAK